MFPKNILFPTITLFLVLFGEQQCYAQEKLIFSGAVLDAEEKGLEGANIILYPNDKLKALSFTTTDENGRFSAQVLSNTQYDLNITFIGFEPIKESINFTNSNTFKEFTLKESAEELEEVILNYTPPIEVKKDTTTFLTDAFVNGKERKLGAVLKKLPGISVNRDGDVFFKDKKVDGVMVENKTFFTGQPKMATQNIPADVVEEVQMIENHNDTPFLKEFESSDNLVMNIVLKEGEKRFFFGDIEAAVGHEERYRFHPSVFKYSPTTVHNFIGDINNTQSKSFTLSDYLNIEGEKSPEAILSILNSPTAKFLQNEDYFRNKHLFGGYNFQFNPDDKSELRIFSLGMLDKSFRQDSNNFIYQPSLAVENKTNERNDRNAIFFGKVKYKYTPDLYTVVKADISYNRSQLNVDGTNFSEIIDELREFGTLNELRNDKVLFNLSADKWFSGNNVSTASFSVENNNEALLDSWRSDTNIFSPQIVLEGTDRFEVKDIGNAKTTNFDFDLKHHYRPKRTRMLTFGLNGKIYRNNIENSAFQVIGENESVSLDGFRNDFSNLLTELNNSLSHKLYVGGNFIFDVGLVLQNISWTDKQFSSVSNFSDSRFLPIGKIEWNFDEKKSIKLSYNMSTTNPDAQSRLSGRVIDDFNRVVLGNSILEQPVNERALFSLSLFKTYGISFYAKLGYRKHKDPIVQSISSDGINVNVSPFQLNGDFVSYDATIRTRYNRRYWKLSLENSFFQRDGISIFNGLQQFNNSLNINNNLEFTTNFEEAPNIEFETRNSFLEYKNPSFTNITWSTDIDFSIVYDYKDWKFDFSIYQNFYNNRSQRNQSYFNLIESRIFYRKEDSPFEIGIELYNLGNSARQISNRYTSVFFVENSKRLFPRTIMLNVNYKL
ncbi:carboxypeptidase-like regulatory domain-containing protein [Zobellia galactanivorans]|uniref:carboxypeptidase-like regulatory domain-containing protein n=1 Tax=Zobellia galactanivorans (strain DSM 12802 / CCUG 47099 / CIP 106680 / NCIMB 13871 / Dsij) TaxID=63186 RepID=UPI001C06E4A9|nr:carboxypeptidase-like regulatory domain-containing protein [Zobellia galactanivorans]MBU3027554.1 carboxypeptidase-like regulatory domain-containing protein [Zobellia galactanivorans]